MSGITASGIVTNTHLSTPDNEWYTTVSTDEVIRFEDHYGKVKQVNSVIVFANTTKLMFSLCRTDSDGVVKYETDKLFVAPNSNLENYGVEFNAIKIYGAAGQKVKYINNMY